MPRKPKTDATSKHTKRGLANKADRSYQVPLLECPSGNGPLAKKEGKAGSSGRFLVCVRVFRKRLIDTDNIAIKSLLDSFRYAGILPDDTESDLIIQIGQQIKVKRDEDERVEFTIYPPDSMETQRAEEEIAEREKRFDEQSTN